MVTGGLAAPLVGTFWAGVLTGAVAGATIGGAMSAATGGNIGQGMLTGAISGAIFGGIGGLNLGGFAHTAAHFAGGAASGAISSSITGSDIGMGALIGGISAGVTQGASNFRVFKMLEGGGAATYLNNVTRRAVLGGLVGGGISAGLGGDFGSGFQNGATSAAISYTANDFMHEAQEKVSEFWNETVESLGYEYRLNEGVILALAPEVKGVEYLLKGETWFARGAGVLNNNPYIRLGWGWNNEIKAEVFRLSIGNKNFKIYGQEFHYHKDFFTKE